METGRGKKGKKTAGQLTVRLVDVILAGIGVVVLMMLSFVLGTLAGRGDIYRAAYSWGLLSPEAKQMAQIIPQATPAPSPAAVEAPAPPAAPAATPTAAKPAPAVAPPAAAPVAAKTPHAAPVTGSIATVPAPVAAPPAALAGKKRVKSAQAQEQKAREDQMRQTHQDVAKKLTFLNSFDSTPKLGQKKDKDKTKATAAKPQPAPVKVATYRDSKSAQAKLAELQKKGIKATVKQGKDGQGVCYTLYRQAPAPANPKETEKVAQSKDKTGAAAPARKPQAE